MGSGVQGESRRSPKRALDDAILAPKIGSPSRSNAKKGGKEKLL